MRQVAVLLSLVVALSVPATAPTVATGPASEIVAVHPNPVADEDRGKSVVLDVPTGGTLGDYALTDGESTIELPDRTVTGRVILGSLNWNNHLARENREGLITLEGRRVATYYRAVFDSDWRRSGQRLPVGVPAALVLVAIACLLAAWRLQFDR